MKAFYTNNPSNYYTSEINKTNQELSDALLQSISSFHPQGQAPYPGIDQSMSGMNNPVVHPVPNPDHVKKVN